MEAYSVEVKAKMKRLFGGLSEKDRRRYAAVEAAKLGHGGGEYLSRVWGCDPKPIWQGLKEWKENEDPVPGRVREKGGGRRPLTESLPALEANLRRLLQEFTAGEPRRHLPPGDGNPRWGGATEYQAAGDPVISVDTKKKEGLGNSHRPGSTSTEQTVETFDHDFGR